MVVGTSARLSGARGAAIWGRLRIASALDAEALHAITHTSSTVVFSRRSVHLTAAPAEVNALCNSTSAHLTGAVLIKLSDGAATRETRRPWPARCEAPNGPSPSAPPASPTRRKSRRFMPSVSARPRRRALEEFVGPGDEVFPVRTIGVSAVVLPPRQLTVEQADVHRGHLFRLVVVGHTEAFRAEQAEHWLGRDGGHVAAL